MGGACTPSFDNPPYTVSSEGYYTTPDGGRGYKVAFQIDWECGGGTVANCAICAGVDTASSGLVDGPYTTISFSPTLSGPAQCDTAISKAATFLSGDLADDTFYKSSIMVGVPNFAGNITECGDDPDDYAVLKTSYYNGYMTAGGS